MMGAMDQVVEDLRVRLRIEFRSNSGRIQVEFGSKSSRNRVEIGSKSGRNPSKIPSNQELGPILPVKRRRNPSKNGFDRLLLDTPVIIPSATGAEDLDPVETRRKPVETRRNPSKYVETRRKPVEIGRTGRNRSKLNRNWSKSID